MLSFLTSIKDFVVGTVSGFFSWGGEGASWGGWLGLIGGGIAAFATGNLGFLLLGGVGGALGGAALGAVGGLLFGGVNEVMDRVPDPATAAPRVETPQATPSAVVTPDASADKAAYDAAARAEAEARARADADALRAGQNTPPVVTDQPVAAPVAMPPSAGRGL